MNTLDITPTPRILRTLGEIPFQTWQCVAELIDNSIDAFLSDKTVDPDEVERKITVTWAADSVAAGERTIEVTDNACGMSIFLQGTCSRFKDEAKKAGWLNAKRMSEHT